MNLTLLLHFLRFDIQTHSLDLEDWIKRLYVSNDLTGRFPNHVASIQLLVENKDAPEAAPIAAPKDPRFAETNLCNGRCYYEDGRFSSANHGAYWHEIEYDVRTHTIHANLGGQYLHSGQFVVSNIIRPILQSFLLPFYRVKTLHGAIISKGVQTILLAGRGGAGKTTMSIAAMQAGYDLLSDDGPFFTTEDDQAYAFASLDYLHLTEHTLQLFPSLQARVVGEKDARDKFAIPTRKLQRTDTWTQPRPVTHYVHMHRHEVATPRIRRMQKGVIHQQLMNESMIIFRGAAFRESAYPFKAYSEFIFDLVAKVVRGAEVYELEFADRHLPDIPALLERL